MCVFLHAPRHGSAYLSEPQHANTMLLIATTMNLTKCLGSKAEDKGWLNATAVFSFLWWWWLFWGSLQESCPLTHPTLYSTNSPLAYPSTCPTPYLPNSLLAQLAVCPIPCPPMAWGFVEETIRSLVPKLDCSCTKLAHEGTFRSKFDCGWDLGLERKDKDKDGLFIKIDRSSSVTTVLSIYLQGEFASLFVPDNP